MKSNNKGFTLIELLVVIAIIGILSSVVLASLNSARRKGRDARRIADVKQLQLALELAYDAAGIYPAEDSGDIAPAVLVSSGYIAAIPADPSGGTYVYEQASSGSSYCLGANLETSGHTALAGDFEAACGSLDFGDTDGCGGEANRYCYNVTP